MSTTTAPPAPRQKPRWRRWLLAVAACLLGLLLVPVIGYVAYAWLAGSELDNAIAETDAVDPRWRMEHLLADRAEIPDEKNGALAVMAVDRVLGRPGFDMGQDNWELFEDLPPEAQLNLQQIDVLRAALGKHPKALEEARKLRRFTEGRFPIVHSKDWLNTNLDPLQRCRNVMALLQYDAMLRAHDGEDKEALESCHAALAAARSIGEEPYLIAMLIRVAGQQIAVNGLERTLAQGQPPDDGLKAMQELLEKEAEAPTLEFGVRGERAGSFMMINQMREGETKFSALVGGPGGGGGGVEDWLISAFPAYFARSQADLLRMMNKAVDATKQPADKRLAAIGDIEDEVRHTKSILPRLLMPAMTKVAQADARTRANLRAAAVGAAAERYRQKHDAWPEDLDALVAKGFLKEAPLDPFDGKQLRWRRLPDGVVIYSVGIDGVDNGGTIDRSQPLARGADLGFRLWDPASRRQPPLLPRLKENNDPDAPPGFIPPAP